MKTWSVLTPYTQSSQILSLLHTAKLSGLGELTFWGEPKNLRKTSTSLGKQAQR